MFSRALRLSGFLQAVCGHLPAFSTAEALVGIGGRLQTARLQENTTHSNAEGGMKKTYTRTGNCPKGRASAAAMGELAHELCSPDTLFF